MHKMAVDITRQEGKKISLPIGQVKEVLRLTLIGLKKFTLQEVAELLARLK